MANKEDVARRKTTIINYRKKLLSHTDYEGLVRSEGLAKDEEEEFSNSDALRLRHFLLPSGATVLEPHAMRVDEGFSEARLLAEVSLFPDKLRIATGRRAISMATGVIDKS